MTCTYANPVGRKAALDGTITPDPHRPWHASRRYEADPNDPLSLAGGGRRRDGPFWEKYSKAGPVSPQVAVEQPAPVAAPHQRTSVVWDEAALGPISPGRKPRLKQGQQREEAPASATMESTDPAADGRLSRRTSSIESPRSLSKGLSSRTLGVIDAIDVDALPKDEQLVEQLGQDGHDLTGEVIEDRVSKVAPQGRCVTSGVSLWATAAAVTEGSGLARVRALFALATPFGLQR